MLLVSKHRALILLTRCRVVRVTALAFRWSNVTWLNLSRVLNAAALHVDLVYVLFESLLTLEAGDVTSSELVFHDPILRDDRLVHLASILPLLARLDKKKD